MTTETQPTVEQSLHSIALSMINIHKELKDTRRIAKDTLRFLKGEARQNATRFVPRKRTVGDWLRDQLRGRRAAIWC
jgi:hypothetical protein